MVAQYKLTSCLWELTVRCNLHCLHCGSSAGRARRNELTPNECFAVAEDIIRLGCEELTLIGGEIFLYAGWHEVARYLSSRNILVNVMSNGYHLGEKQIEEIRYARLRNVGISIDGMETNHEAIRSRKGAFAQVKQAFDLLNDAEIPLGAVTSLLQLNLGDLDCLYDYLLENNVKVWQLQLVNPMGRMLGRKDLLVKPRDVPRLTNFIREKNKDRAMLVVAGDSIGYHDANESYLRGNRTCVCYWQGCQAGISSVFIDSVGNVKGCGALYSGVFIEGNLRKSSLPEIWNDTEKFSYNRKFDAGLLKGRCAECDMAEICRGGCRASNYFTTASLYENAFCVHRPPLRAMPDEASRSAPQMAYRGVPAGELGEIGQRSFSVAGERPAERT